MYRNYYVEDIKTEFKHMMDNEQFRDGMLEIRGATFIADQPCMFGKPNQKYIEAEIEWYNSQSKSVYNLFDLYGKKVQIWEDVADEYGEVNSNYGWCIFSPERGNQFKNAYRKLLEKPYTRQAVLIYQHPDMHMIAGKDFTCTNMQQFFIVDNKLECLVQMRSQDAVFGYNNDIAWFKHVQTRMLAMINRSRYEHGAPELSLGPITMQVSSLHVYPRHQHYVENYVN
jgi:thymidylate synthase